MTLRTSALYLEAPFDPPPLTTFVHPTLPPSTINTHPPVALRCTTNRHSTPYLTTLPNCCPLTTSDPISTYSLTLTSFFSSNDKAELDPNKGRNPREKNRTETATTRVSEYSDYSLIFLHTLHLESESDSCGKTLYTRPNDPSLLPSTSTQDRAPTTPRACTGHKKNGSSLAPSLDSTFSTEPSR